MKKNQGGFTVVELMAVVLLISVIGSWVINGYKLTQCDFEVPYKGEIIHGIGLVPVASIFTVWNDDK